MKSRSLRASHLKPVYFTTLLLGVLFLVTACGEEKPQKDSEKSADVAKFEAACKDGSDEDDDGKTDCDDTDCQSPGGECVPAPALDRTVATTVYESAEYLFTGKNPLQKDVAAGVITKQQVALLRGRVIDANGKGLAGAKITVKGHAEYGYTYSRGDGFFDLAVNGGARLVLDFERADYLTVQRAVQPGWQQYVTVPDAGMIVASTETTEVTSGRAESQLILGKLVEDDYGKRQPLVVMEPNTVATAVLADGKEKELDKLSISITEYPITPNQEYLPGSSPSQGGLAYGLQFAVKEADALKAEHVAFSKPVSVYVENIGDLDVGRKLTVQHYDEAKGQWEPGVHGSVLQILEVNDGKATLDTDGDGKADDVEQLKAQGITASDLEELGKRFKAEQKLWHGEMKHFSAGLLQAQGTPPANALPPVRRGLITKTLDAPTYAQGMVIETQASTHNEPIVGTPFSLHYQSNRTYSYGAGRTLEVPLVGDALPPGLTGINVRVSVAGRNYDGSFPIGSDKLAPNLRFTAIWDGRNSQGNLVQGQQVAEVTIAYAYPDAKSASVPAVLTTKFTVPLGGWDAREFRLGGFAIDAFHAYDPAQQILYFGHGGQRTGSNVSLVAKSAVSQPDFDLGTPDSLIVASDGSLILTDDQQNTENFGRVIRVTPDGTPSVLFGPGAPGDAAEAELYQPQGVVVLSDGRLIVSDLAFQRIVELSPDGSLRTLVSSYEEDDPEFFFSLDAPTGLTLGPREELYFVDQGKVFRYEGGEVEVFAGGGTKTEDGVLATEALLVEPNSLVVDPDNNVYVSERGIPGQNGGNRVRKILNSGVITTIAGNGTAGYAGDGEDAKSAQLNNPHGLALDADGQLYIVDMGNDRIRRISADGLIQTVIGGGDQPLDTLSLAVNAQLSTPDGIATGPDGSLYIATQNKVIRSYVGLPQLSSTDHLVPSTDGRTLYRFDERGRHLETIDAVTRVTELKFGYSSAGLLETITDKNGNVTKIKRDGSGLPSEIIAPYGQITKLGIKAEGDVESITDPIGRTTTISWTATKDGMVSEVKDPKSRTWLYSYDATGRLTELSDPTGYNQTLSRANVDSGWSVTLTDHATVTRTSEYLTQNKLDTWTHTVTLPDGAKREKTVYPGITKKKFVDGTQTAMLLAPDPYFGAQVLTPIARTTVLPSGKQLVSVSVEAKSLGASKNPLSYESWFQTGLTGDSSTLSTFQPSTRTFTHTGPTGQVTSLVLDELGRPLTTSAAGMPRYDWNYKNGKLEAVTATANDETRITKFSYDDRGYVGSLVDPLGLASTYVRDDVGRIKGLTGADQSKTFWEPDDANNIKTLTPPGHPNYQFTYDPTTHLLTQSTPPAIDPANAGIVKYDYRKEHQLSTITLADGKSIGFDYNTWGQLTKQTLGSASINYGYTRGQLTRVNRSDGVTVDMTYDGPLWTGSSWSGGVQGNIKVTYDSYFRPASLTVNDASAVNYTYDLAGSIVGATTFAGAVAWTRSADTGQISSTTIGNTTSQLGYSPFLELAHQSVTYSGTSLFEQNIVARDLLGRVRHLTETVQGTTHDVFFEYDTTGRLVKEVRDGVTTTFGYDISGNRTTTQVGSAAQVISTYDEQDRLLTIGGTKCENGVNGELRKRPSGTSNVALTYDELGNLMQAVVTGTGAATVDYTVDGLGRRVGRRLNGNFDRKWLYRDALRPEAEVDANGVFTQYIYESNDPNSGAPTALARAGVLYRVVKDQLGSVRLVVNAQTGVVAQSIDYDAFGNVVRETGAGFQPFGFAGGLYDATTKLVRFGARDYDPTIARWTNRDPIGFAGQQGNQYVYVAGDPVNRVDPRGLADFFRGVDLDLVGIVGAEVSLGLVFDSDHFLQSGIYVSGGFAAGASVGMAVQDGMVCRDIEGWGTSVDLNLKVLSPVVIMDDKGINGMALGAGPGVGLSGSATYTWTLSPEKVMGWLQSLLK